MPKRETPIEPSAAMLRNKPSWDPKVEDLIRQSQDTLARFLLVEVEIGLTFIELAKASNIRIEPERRTALKNQAELALRNVKGFKDRLDRNLRERIESRLAELELAVSSV